MENVDNDSNKKKTPANYYLTGAEIFENYIVGLSYKEAKNIVDEINFRINEVVNKLTIPPQSDRH